MDRRVETSDPLSDLPSLSDSKSQDMMPQTRWDQDKGGGWGWAGIVETLRPTS